MKPTSSLPPSRIRRARCLAPLALLVLLVSACKSAPESSAPDLWLCAACGHYKGSSECCLAFYVRCPRCGRNANAPGCCLAELDRGDLRLCAECGEVRDSRACCAKDAERCPTCGYQRGAPACCERFDARAFPY